MAAGATGVMAQHGLHGATPVMGELFQRLMVVGRANGPVLITGEAGTGKELVARALHAESGRREAPLVALHCSALPPDQVERDLFGPGRAGAVSDRGGLYEVATGGTLFLDAIGDLGPSAQARLLQALESGPVTPLGEARPTGASVRVIAATSRPLGALARAGRFRADLLDRLSATALTLPPLRERKGDLPILAAHFLGVFAERRGVSPGAVSDEVWAILERYDWPGNVRELRSVLEGAVAMSDGVVIRPGDLPASLLRSPVVTPRPLLDPPADLPFVEARERALREFDRAYLSAALVRHGGNIARTARALGLHRQSLQKLLARRDLRHV